VESSVVAHRLLARLIRYLKLTVGRRRDHAEARRFIEHRRGVAEEFPLLGEVVDGVEPRRCAFKPKTVPIAARRDEIFRVSEAAAIIGARRKRLAAAAIEADLAARGGEAPACDIEHAGGAKAVFRRQRAGEQRDIADEIGVEKRAKRGDAFRHNDAVDPDLRIGVIAADVEARIGDRRIVGHARELQNELVDRRIVGLRHPLDCGAADACARCAELREQIIVARVVELLGLGVECGLRGGRCVDRHRFGRALNGGHRL